MTIRKTLMSMVSLSSLVVLALAVAPAIAAEKEQLTVGTVTLTLTVGADSSDKNDFKIKAINSGDAQPTCTVKVVFTNKDHKAVDAKYADPYPFVVKIGGRSSGEQPIGSGLFDKNELPVTHTWTADCH